MGIAFRILRRPHGGSREGRRAGYRFQYGHSDTHRGHSHFAWSVALVTDHQPLSQVAKRTWIFLILSGIATGLSWLCYFRALQLGQVSRVAPIDKLSVVVAIVLAAIFLREHLTWHHYVGGAFIFAGAVVLAYA